MGKRLLFHEGTIKEKSSRIYAWLAEHREPNISNLRSFCGLIDFCNTNDCLTSPEEEFLYEEIIQDWTRLSFEILGTTQKAEELPLLVDLMFDSPEVSIWLLKRWTVLAKSWEDCRLGYLFQPSDWKRFNRKTGGLESDETCPYPVLGQYDYHCRYEMAKKWAKYCISAEKMINFYFIMAKYDVRDGIHFSGTNWRPWRLIIAINRWLELDPNNQTLQRTKEKLRDRDNGRRKLSQIVQVMGNLEHDLNLNWQTGL